MPCQYYTAAEEAAMAEEREKHRLAELDKLTAMLCSACRLLDKNGLLMRESEVGKWYTQHELDDKARQEAEREAKAKRRATQKLKDSAFAKLSPEEQKALGLKED